MTEATNLSTGTRGTSGSCNVTVAVPQDAPALELTVVLDRADPGGSARRP